jgi:hypothetical protein
MNPPTNRRTIVLSVLAVGLVVLYVVMRLDRRRPASALSVAATSTADTFLMPARGELFDQLTEEEVRTLGLTPEKLARAVAMCQANMKGWRRAAAPVEQASPSGLASSFTFTDSSGLMMPVFLAYFYDRGKPKTLLMRPLITAALSAKYLPRFAKEDPITRTIHAWSYGLEHDRSALLAICPGLPDVTPSGLKLVTWDDEAKRARMALSAVVSSKTKSRNGPPGVNPIHATPPR